MVIASATTGAASSAPSKANNERGSGREKVRPYRTERLRFSGHSMLCPYKTEYRKRQRARTARRRMLSYGNFLETRLGAN
jgi:hypothetical protein